MRTRSEIRARCGCPALELDVGRAPVSVSARPFSRSGSFSLVAQPLSGRSSPLHWSLRALLRVPLLRPHINPHGWVHSRTRTSRLRAPSKSQPGPHRPSPATVSRLYYPSPIFARLGCAFIMCFTILSRGLSTKSPAPVPNLVLGGLVSATAGGKSTLPVPQHISLTPHLVIYNARSAPR